MRGEAELRVPGSLGMRGTVGAVEVWHQWLERKRDGDRVFGVFLSLRSLLEVGSGGFGRHKEQHAALCRSSAAEDPWRMPCL